MGNLALNYTINRALGYRSTIRLLQVEMVKATIHGCAKMDREPGALSTDDVSPAPTISGWFQH